MTHQIRIIPNKLITLHFMVVEKPLKCNRSEIYIRLNRNSLKTFEYTNFLLALISENVEPCSSGSQHFSTT